MMFSQSSLSKEGRSCLRRGADRRALRIHAAEGRGGQEHPSGLQLLVEQGDQRLVLLLGAVPGPGVFPVHVHAVKPERQGHFRDLLRHGGDLLRRVRALPEGGLQRDVLIAPPAQGEADLRALRVGLGGHGPGKLRILQRQDVPVLRGDGKGVVHMGHDVEAELGQAVLRLAEDVYDTFKAVLHGDEPSTFFFP